MFINTPQCKIDTTKNKPTFIVETLTMAGEFTVLFSLLFCFIKPVKEDSYARRMGRLRACKYNSRNYKKYSNHVQILYKIFKIYLMIFKNTI